MEELFPANFSDSDKLRFAKRQVKGDAHYLTAFPVRGYEDFKQLCLDNEVPDEGMIYAKLERLR